MLRHPPFIPLPLFVAAAMVACHRNGSLVPTDPVIVGAGDIASCDDLHGAITTANLLDSIPGTVIAIGDLAYPDGSEANFADCYGPTWGRFRSRTRPAPGNHEYHQDRMATAYARYFGAAAGDSMTGYYSYDLGHWHIVALNSECLEAGGCGATAPETVWLDHDLADHRRRCTLAYFHRPLFSSGAAHGDEPVVRPFWEVLYAHGVDVVVNGHDHDYERFAPQDPDGRRDDRHGIREFVVGTGGKNSHRVFGPSRPNSESRTAEAFGVLKLVLHDGSYDWQFVAEPGHSFADSGTGSCHPRA